MENIKEVVGRIYAITDDNFEIKYIGQTVSSIIDRWYSHKSECKIGKNKTKKNYWLRKHLDEAKIVELCVCYTYEEMDEIERSLIAIIGLENLLNQETGGKKYKKHSPESRAKMSKSQTGKKQSDESKNKKSKTLLQPITLISIIDYEIKYFDNLTKCRKELKLVNDDMKLLKSGVVIKNFMLYDEFKSLDYYKGFEHKQIIKISIISIYSNEIKSFESLTSCYKFLNLQHKDMKLLKNGEIVKGYKKYIH